MAQSGGAVGIHDLKALESVLAQPRATYGGEELYPTIQDKAAILGYLLIKTILFLMATNELVMPQWKCFCC